MLNRTTKRLIISSIYVLIILEIMVEAIGLKIDQLAMITSGMARRRRRLWDGGVW